MIGEYKIVALCMSRIHESFSHDFILEFAKALKTAGYRLFVYNACSDLLKEESQNNGQQYTYDLIDYSVIDVLVVYEDRIRNRRISDSIIAKGLQAKVPVIVLGDAHPGCINIASNDPLGMEKMVCHLIEEHGVKRLHFVAGIKDEHYSDERIAAFRRVLARHNISYDDSMLSYGEYWSGPTEAAVERIIAAGTLPEAFVCVNDHTALSVCSALKRHGIEVPKQVKVTGYDGLFETKISTPTVSTVNCSIREYAEQTLKAVDSVFSGTWEEKTVLFEPELWRLESCGCGKKKSIWAPEYIISLKDSIFRFQMDNQEMAEVAAKLQRCENPSMLSHELHNERLYNICCVIEKRFLNEEITLSDTVEQKKDKDYVLLYDSETEDFSPRPFQKEEICPKLMWFLEINTPLIFSALSYLNVPMGYICFFYQEFDVSHLLMLPQVSTFIGAGIGGYVNMRHEHYLNSKIEKMYRVDTLTGLYNRRGFSIEYQRLLAEGDNDKLTVIMADVDGLKKINDKYGHAEGDIAICTVADALRKSCPLETIAVRFGGDEMLAVCKGEQDAAEIRGRFNEYLMRWNEKERRPYELNASVGVYITEAGHEPEFEELVICSDRMMYMEKEKRKAEATQS